MKEEYWGSKEQPHWRPGANLAVDIVVVQNDHVLLIKRDQDPGKGSWALPGGFHETDAPKGKPWIPGKETAREATLRELEEETGISREVADAYLQPLAIFDRFGRDPRDNEEAFAISQVFTLFLPDDLKVKINAASDAADARWFTREEAEKLEFPFDHSEMLQRAGFLAA
jgi:8-oxo-dGTP diphosphatase